MKLRTITIVASALLALPAAADPTALCDHSLEQDAHQEVATASVLSNVLARPASIRSKSTSLLRQAWKEAETAVPPQGVCPDGCTSPVAPEIVFRSTPRKVRTGYADEDYCGVKLRETRESPIVFSRSFASNQQIEKWVRDLAMGDGADGESLYEQCDRGCSPRYTYVIRNEGADYQVDTSIICGHARDRGDNKFDLSYTLRWSCEIAPERNARRATSRGQTMQ